jgi:hypothetical protein
MLRPQHRSRVVVGYCCGNSNLNAAADHHSAATTKKRRIGRPRLLPRSSLAVLLLLPLVLLLCRMLLLTAAATRLAPRPLAFTPCQRLRVGVPQRRSLMMMASAATPAAGGKPRVIVVTGERAVGSYNASRRCILTHSPPFEPPQARRRWASRAWP